MALNDITLFDGAAFGYAGDASYKVALGATPPAINAGEPVARILGSTGNVVSASATSTPTSADASHLILGIAATTSTETTTAAGTVSVLKLVPGATYLISPKTAATWNTQAKYDALVGSRMTLDLTSGVYTINATDNAANGCIVEPLDISQYPGKVRFSVRSAAQFGGWATGIS